MTPVIIPLPGNFELADELQDLGPCQILPLQLHRFPDEEVLVKLIGDLQGRDAIFLCSLERPDDKILPLAFLADLARELGASRIGLIAPYLAYMRQDARFSPGEAISSRPFARILSQTFDWLLTVDPHLHRYRSLQAIYSIRTKIAHAAPAMAKWIVANVAAPVLVGPDGESAQWVSEVARDCGAPYIIMSKMRGGDRAVHVTFSDIAPLLGRTPVLVDDVVSSGHTLLAAIDALKPHATGIPVCLAVHGVFSGEAYHQLLQSGARVLTTNSIAHPSNAISLAPSIACALTQLLASL